MPAEAPSHETYNRKAREAREARVVQIFASPAAYAAVLTDGGVRCWGSARHGGEASPAVLEQLRNVKSVCKTQVVFPEVLPFHPSDGKLFQDLIHDQPDDPWAYIDQRTGEARTADLINKAQQKKVEEANLGGLQQAPDLPELPPNLEDDDGVLQTEEEVLDNIRVKAHNALMKAAEDGSLEKALNFDKAQASLEEIRQKAAQHLMKAAQDGSLEKALAGKGMNMDEIDAIRQEAAQTLLKAAHQDTDDEKKRQGLDALRQEAAQTLLKAAQDGTLEAVLRKKPADQEVESIRAQAAATLLKAAEDGTLQKVLSSQSVDQDLNLLRQEAAQTLLKAAEDGSLEAVLKKKGTDQQDLDVLRQEAAQTLLKAAQNGTLQAVLSQKTGQDMDKLREDAASLLLKAAEDGTLEAVLSSRVKVQKDQEQLRTKAAGILLRAAEDGTLEDVLMKKAAMKDPEQLRHQAAATLLKAAENGTLEEVLKSKAKGSDLEAIRLEAARALCKAVEVPGTLEAALAKARGQAVRVMEGRPWCPVLWMLSHLLMSPVSCDTSCMLQHRHVGPAGIPCTIHQLDTGELSKTSSTWTWMNPECNHKRWNATQVDALVREESPDLIWPIWDSLSLEERGDVFRYLVIWHQGGYWADSDVACLKPIADFPVPSNATMIVGYEFGHRWSEKQRQEVNFARTEQFAKYFFAAAPRNPVLLRCLRMVRQRYTWKILQTSDFTGSALFSDAVNEFLESDESLNKETS
eukprot:s172_g11.t1